MFSFEHKSILLTWIFVSLDANASNYQYLYLNFFIQLKNIFLYYLKCLLISSHSSPMDEIITAERERMEFNSLVGKNSLQLLID